MPADPKHIRSLRRKAEKSLSEAPEKLALMPGIDLKELIHELSVREIELEMQSEELRRSQEQLKESRSAYADLYDFVPVGYLTLAEKGFICRANLAAGVLLGIILEEASSSRNLLPSSSILSPKIYSAPTHGGTRNDAAQTCELVLRSKGGAFLFHF